MKTIDALRGNESIILDYYDIYITGNKHIDCVFCDKKEKSMRISMYKDNLIYICTCSTGSIIEYIREITGSDFATTAKKIDELIGNTGYKCEPKPVDNRASNALRRFKKAPSLRGTDGEKYLNGRDIYTMPELGIKFSESRSGHNFLFAIATDDQYKAVMMHQTFLQGDKKADIELNKKMITLKESMGSISVKMFHAQETLGIGEGIESALSAAQIYKGSVWAVLSSSLMKRFKAPIGVSHLIIYADHDKKGAGFAAAFDCASKNLLCRNDVKRVTVKYPSEQGYDFNDVLIKGCTVHEIRLGEL